MEPLYIQILEELYRNTKDIFKKIRNDALKKIISILMRAKKIYVLGIGHSGMFGKILSMKLNHVGLKAFTVFDEINPPFEKDDVFVAISQSGETSTIVGNDFTCCKSSSFIAGWSCCWSVLIISNTMLLFSRPTSATCLNLDTMSSLVSSLI